MGSGCLGWWGFLEEVVGSVARRRRGALAAAPGQVKCTTVSCCTHGHRGWMSKRLQEGSLRGEEALKEDRMRNHLGKQLVFVALCDLRGVSQASSSSPPMQSEFLCKRKDIFCLEEWSQFKCLSASRFGSVGCIFREEYSCTSHARRSAWGAPRIRSSSFSLSNPCAGQHGLIIYWGL